MLRMILGTRAPTHEVVPDDEKERRDAEVVLMRSRVRLLEEEAALRRMARRDR